MKQLFCFSLLVILTSTAFYAQKGDIREGYILDNDENRVEGYIQVSQDIVDQEVKVKFSEKKNVKKYKLYKTRDLVGYGFTELRKNNLNQDSIHWRNFIKYEFERPARIFATNFSFIENIVNGPLTLYQFVYETGADVANPTETRFIVIQDGEEICQIGSDNFKESASQLFEGYDALVTSLDKVKFKFENFPRMLSDYNYWLINKHDPSVYKLNPKIFNQ